MANKNKAKNQPKAPVAPVDKTEPMDVVRVALETVRGSQATPEAVTKMTAALKRGGVKIEPVLNRSLVGGHNVTSFQNVLYIMNARDGWKFTDAELAIAWAACLPLNSARCANGAGFIADPTKYVGGTRTLFNGGKHGPTPTAYPFIKSMRYLGATNAPAPQPTTDTQPTEAELPTAAPTEQPTEGELVAATV